MEELMEAVAVLGIAGSGAKSSARPLFESLLSIFT